jgi:hypothetical protein
VHAEKQLPSITTFSPDERSAAKACRYCPIWPPRSSEMTMVAEADDAPLANKIAPAIKLRKRMPRPLFNASRCCAVLIRKA